MTYLVTGCAGFIGSHLTERLLKDGHRVIGIDNLSTGTRANVALLDSYKAFTFYEADVSEIHSIHNLFYEYKIDGIFHQAALGSVPRSISNSIQTFQANVMGFEVILTLARDYRVKKIVYASSSSVHGINGVLQSPYAASKRINECQGEAWATAYNMGIIGLRYFNVFGPRQNPDGPYAAVIPKWLKSIKNNQAVEIYGDGEQTRDFTYVKDVVEANLRAMNSCTQGNHLCVDIGSGRPYSLIELAENFVTLGIAGSLIVKRLDERKGDIKNSKANIERAKELINFVPQYDLIKGLEDMKCHYAWALSDAASSAEV